ncbi:uncharacterized protein ELE39_001402 [Cryptosporidium sp. chipmunk genotype I]|uniref:uncharacterized protein n=1 Tax=Cryptosporidium sp. chipmunk genotype I TaxID=1280935 RepID=UPI00351A75CE|nr:hypothetical protein ELE39_001402 [Cryptosporidium sp. chipmunk genotype I]
MKVKVILRAPKSQIPLYMTLNDAKFGNEEVTTSLNVVESDEVVRWVNNTSEKSPTNLQIAPQKQLVISEDLARSISNSISEKFKSNNKGNNIIENRIRDLKSNSNLSSARHKYNVCHVKDAFPGKNIVSELANKNENGDVKANNNDTDKDDINGEKSQEIGKIEKLLSQDLDKILSPNSGSMGASVGIKYNGKELKSNIRRKYFKSSNSKNIKSDYEYNKKFRSNEDFPEDCHELFPSFNDSSNEKETDCSPKDSDFEKLRNSEIIQKKIQDEIDRASKIESIQCEIVKTFKNLTLSPCLCKSPKSPNNPYDRNQAIFQKYLFINELHEKVPLKNSHNYVSPKNDSRNMYLLIHGSGKEAESTALSKDLEPNNVCNLSNELPTSYQAKISKSPKNSNSKNTSHELNSDPKFEHVSGDKDQEINHPESQNEGETQDQIQSGAQDGNGDKVEHVDGHSNRVEDLGEFKVENESKVSGEKKNQKEDLGPKSQLLQALSKLSLELSNANSALDQCLREKEDVVSFMGGLLIKGLQDKLDNLELLYKRIKIKQGEEELPEDLDIAENQKKDFHSTDDQNEFHNDNKANTTLNKDEYKYKQHDHDHFEETYPTTNSAKVPNTDLPLLTDEVPFQKEDQTNLITKRLPIQKIVQSYNESLEFQPLNRLESKRSISVPVHENQFSNLYSEKITKSIEEMPSMYELQVNHSRSKNLTNFGSFSSINSNNSITSKPPLSKVGLKPNSSSERLSLNNKEGLRGRTKLQGPPHSRTATRDFVAENKSNVALNASKSSSSLLQSNPSKKSTKLIKKKSSNEKANQNSFNTDDNNGKVNTINHNQHHLHQNEFNNFSSRDEIYPSLEVGGPIARMNGTCGGFLPCFPGSYLNTHYDPHFGNLTANHYNRNNYQYINNQSQFPQHQQPNYQRVNGYFGTNGFVDNTPRCPYWCNLICRI